MDDEPDYKIMPTNERYGSPDNDMTTCYNLDYSVVTWTGEMVACFTKREHAEKFIKLLDILGE